MQLVVHMGPRDQIAAIATSPPRHLAIDAPSCSLLLLVPPTAATAATAAAFIAMAARVQPAPNSVMTAAINHRLRFPLATVRRGVQLLVGTISWPRLPGERWHHQLAALAW